MGIEKDDFDFGMETGETFDDDFSESNDWSSNDNTGSTDSGFDSSEFDSMTNSSEDIEDVDTAKVIKKNTIIVIIAGLVIIIAALMIWKKASASGQKMIYTKSADEVSQESNYQQSSNMAESSNIAESNVSSSNSEWITLSGDQTIDSIKEVESQFTVTSIEHLAKKSGNEMQIKTHLRGSLSGLTGVYDLDVPYEKGTKLKVGDVFTVTVEVGSYNDSTVVGVIRF